MSTLLNALRRAEQPQGAPYIPAMGLAIPRTETKSRRPLLSALSLLTTLLLGAAANYAWHLLHLRPIEQKVEVKQQVTPDFVRVEPKAMITRPLPEPSPEPVVVRPKIKVTARTPQLASPAKAPSLSLAEQLMKALNETPLAGQNTRPNQVQPAQLMSLTSAPSTIRQQVPTFNYGSHLFSSDPQKRSVILNGREYREGSTLSQGVTLVTIAQEYIVLDVNGQTVSLKALQDWRG